MQFFDFRLEAQDGSGHYREGTISIGEKDLEVAGAKTAKEAARILLERQEARKVAFQLGDEHVAELEAPPDQGGYGRPIGELLDLHPAPLKATEEEKAPFRALNVKHRAWLNLHRQEKPYKLVSLTKATG